MTRLPYRFLSIPLPLLLLLALLGGTVAVASAATDQRVAVHAPARGARPVIVAVEGDRANGFTIHYANGSSISPPTDSEASAECGEYDTQVARVRCRAEVRTWYRDLGDLKRSLAWVRAHE